ncbi:MAG: ribonuclease Z [Nanoarchaeota archaeon]|nr:ribonuclease Z [Nanoarchaeota archaeon]
MEDIKITFLGTGSAVPSPTRNHTGILAQLLNESILVDCGEGTQIQFRKAEISPHKITKLLITHWHGDHILGIPGLFQTLALSDYSKTLEIYGPKGSKEFMNSINILLGHHKISYKLHEVNSGKIFEDENYFIEAKEMSHGLPSLAYSIVLKDKLRLDKNKLKKLKVPNSPIIRELLKGKNIKLGNKTIKSKQVTYKEKGKKLTIILDTLFNKNAISIAKNSDLLITESSFLESSEKGAKLAKDYKHLTAHQSAQIAKKSKSKKLILTHISERYSNDPLILKEEAKKVFKNTEIASDLQVITL